MSEPHFQPDTATAAAPRKKVAGVTLCAVDTRTPELALRALALSLRHLEFGKALLLTHRTVGLDALPASEHGVYASIEQRLITPLPSAAAYSDFVLRELVDYVDTPHALIAQWDGFVWDASVWTDEFLAYDYIGAPWAKADPGKEVGNGGFCLRSRALMRAVQSLHPLHHPEDVCIAKTHREALEQDWGLRFAPVKLAARFAFENEVPTGATFGFHGMRNLHRVLGPQQAAEWLGTLPDAMFNGRDAYKTARDLLQDGHPTLARQVLERRKAAGARDWKTRVLGWRVAIRGRSGPNSS
jgi:hypothetical protein